jgi:hypothetical protein
MFDFGSGGRGKDMLMVFGRFEEEEEERSHGATRSSVLVHAVMHPWF